MSWSLSEIGAAASSHTHNYLPLTGGTLSKQMTVQTESNTDEPMYISKRSDIDKEIRFGIGGTGTAGIYSANLSKWLISTDGQNVSYAMKNEWGNSIFNLAFRVGTNLSGKEGFITFSC